MADPVGALRAVAYLMERQREPTYRVRAYRNAADALATLSAGELATRAQAGTLTDLRDVGPKTAALAVEALLAPNLDDAAPALLRRLRESARVPVAAGGESLMALIQGDCHTHSNESDGGSPVIEMARTGREVIGHAWMVLTDHSPRLTVANGLSPARLRDQIRRVERLNEDLAPFRLLTGIEVDILEDGSLDQEADLLERLDVVVASVHSKLRMERAQMTRRMVTAVANPHVDVLGHCTGRLVEGERGTRPPSSFDAELVFAACRRFAVAVEINARPERRDPPRDLLRLAVETGCWFSLDTDAHAPGQLDWQPFGAARAVECGVDPGRVVTTWDVERLLDWTTRARS